MIKVKIIIILLFSVLTTVSLAQCKYSKNEIDKFTGIEKVETNLELLHKDFNSTVSFNFCKYDSLYFIKVGLNLTDKVYSIMEGGKLMLVCGETILSLTSTETRVIKDFVYINYKLKKEELSIINKHIISNIRIYLRDTYIEKEITLKRAEKILKLSNCI
jgi:hypothetical protein